MSNALTTRSKSGPSPRYKTLKDAIEALSVKVPFSGCWIWVGSTQNGYGQLTYAGEHMRAHRASLLAFRGLSPKLACHHCDVRECVNPDHLYAGDYVSNRADMISRSRWAHPYALRSECAAGHNYKASGFYVSKSDGSRVCRACQREAKQKQRSKV